MIVVSPDVGPVVRARALAKRLDDADLAIIANAGHAQRVQGDNIIGDVEGKSCVLIDDMVDTAGTLCQGARALKDEGAVRASPISPRSALGRGDRTHSSSVLERTGRH